MLKFAGYVPLLGAVVGIGRIADMVFIHKTREYRLPLHLMAARFARATLEIARIAAVLLPLDAACTCFKVVFTDRFDMVAAIKSDDSDFVKLALKDRKLDPNIARPGGWLPLHIAVERALVRGRLDVVTVLLEDPRVNPNVATREGLLTALMMAVGNLDVPLVRAILANPATDPNTRNIYGETALRIAMRIAMSGKKNDRRDAIVEILLKDERVLPGIACHKGYSSLNYAVETSWVRGIKLLLEKGERVRPDIIQGKVEVLAASMKFNAYTPPSENSVRIITFLREFFELCLEGSTENVMENGDLDPFKEALNALWVDLENLWSNAPDEDSRTNAAMRLDSIDALRQIFQGSLAKSARKA